MPLRYHAEDTHADVGFGTFQELEQRLGLEHDLATRHGCVKQIRVTLLVNDDDTVVRHIKTFDLCHQRDEITRAQHRLHALVVEPRALEVRETVLT